MPTASTNGPHLDAYSPPEIAQRVESVGVAKARTDALTLFLLAGLAGAFISLGAFFYTVVVTGSHLGFGVTRLLGGLSFSLGLVLVIVAGAELFTGNNLIAMAWASRKIRTTELLRNWGIVYVGNVTGCLWTAFLLLWSDIDTAGGAIDGTALAIAHAKIELSIGAMFTRGVLCNALVCLAVWLALGGVTVTDKILAILLPITAFVTIGFEHSIANWFFLPYAILIDGRGVLDWSGALTNLVVVTAGNIVGGTLLVAGVYWTAYLRRGKRSAP